MNFELSFDDEAGEHFAKLDNSIKQRLWKKIEQLKTKEKSRHLKHGVPFFVEEVEQYRIAYKQDDQARLRKIYFIGDHKEYDQWLKNFGLNFSY